MTHRGSVAGADERAIAGPSGRLRREPRQRPRRAGRQHDDRARQGRRGCPDRVAGALAETLHTVADAGNEVFLFVAIRRSRRPADASHPFGYGPERYYWALLAAIGMFVIGGAVSIWDGIRALIHPPELEAFWVGVGVLVIALVLDGLSRTVALRQLRTQAARRQLSLRQLLRESADPTVVTVYFEDTIDVLGALLALAALVLHRLTGSSCPTRSRRS